MSAGSRLAVVFPRQLEPIHMDKDVGLIPEGLRRRGWEVELHCTGASAHDWPVPVEVAPEAELRDPARWRGRSLQAAVVYTYVVYPEVAEAVRAAGVARVVGKGDTEGRVDPRLHPRSTLVETLLRPGTPRERVLAAASWAARVGPLHRGRMRAVQRTVAASHAFVVETEPARRQLAEALTRRGAAELAGRLHTLINPVAPVFTRGEVAAEREPLVVAVGRWDDPQKNAPRLARALREFLAARPEYRAHVVGAGAEARFERGPRLSVTRHVEQGELRPLLARARIVASSSRWESFSLVSHEGLACGCSVVGPPLAPFVGATELGPYGTLATERGPAGLAAALTAEAGAWDRGERDPRAIAERWRGLLDVDAVAERLDALLVHPSA
ncbi:MAG TPA: glycosyltransferase [Thermoleophilaceae bacterium]|jgi:glycosyltransferase involved in cell wall biosynthesis